LHILRDGRRAAALDTRFLRFYKVRNCCTCADRFNTRKDNPVNKSELIEAVAKSAGLSKSGAERAIDGALSTIKGALKSGQSVTLVGFGTFRVGKRSQRNGRNPRTGAEITIKAARVPKFSAGKALKDALN
jgi:DNA-binding protein HU-beta